VRSSIRDEPLPIRADRIQLQQVVLNLIVNAMDAMSSLPPAERKIAISTTRNGGFAEVSISDMGPGIPEDTLKDIFAAATRLRPLMACAVTRRRFPVGASPTRQTLQPEATEQLWR
jgi:signal transduction histidine kinase